MAELSIRSYRGIDLGLGQADPGVTSVRILEEQHPGHLILIQAGKFLHGYDRTAYALATLKKYKLKLVGTAADPHIRVGFPAGNFKRRLWAVIEEFGIPYVVALGTQAIGHTVYISSQPTGNNNVLESVSPQVIEDVIQDLKQRGELNKAAAGQLLANPDAATERMMLQVEEPGRALDVRQRLRNGYLVPLKYLTAGERPLELANELLKVTLDYAVEVDQLAVDVVNYLDVDRSRFQEEESSPATEDFNVAGMLGE